MHVDAQTGEVKNKTHNFEQIAKSALKFLGLRNN